MPTLTIRDFPSDMAERLKARARQNGRSMEQEAREILGSRLEPVDRSHLGAFLPHSCCSSPVFLANSAYSLRKQSLISTNATKKSPSKHSYPQTLAARNELLSEMRSRWDDIAKPPSAREVSGWIEAGRRSAE